jgi:hypothetical protein
VVAAQAGEYLPQSAGRHAFEAVGKPGDSHGGRVVHRQVPMFGWPLNWAKFDAGICACIPRDLLYRFLVPCVDTGCRSLVTKTRWA